MGGGRCTHPANHSNGHRTSPPTAPHLAPQADEHEQENHPDWRGSHFRGDVVVRAVDEATARHLPSLAYGVAVPRRRGADSFIQPWRELADCDEETGTGFEAIGFEGVLSPARYYLRYFERLGTSGPTKSTLLMTLDEAIEGANRLAEQGAVGIELVDENNDHIRSILSA